MNGIAIRGFISYCNCNFGKISSELSKLMLYCMDSKVINNHAYNPSAEPSTATTEEFETTNEQVVRKGKKNKMDAYNELFDMIHSDFTAEFLKKFDRLFVLFAEPNQNKWYVTDTEGGE